MDTEEECPVIETIETPNKKGELNAKKFVTTQVVKETLQAVANKREESYKCTELESDEENQNDERRPTKLANSSNNKNIAQGVAELLSDDEKDDHGNIATAPSSASKKKLGMSFEDYKKKPEVAQKMKKNNFYDWVACNIFYSNDCSNIFVAVAIVSRNGTNSLSFPHYIFNDAVMCAAHCELDIPIIAKYSDHLIKGELVLKRAIPHGKNECSYNVYKETKTEHKLTGFVFPRNGMDIKGITCEMQNLFDSIVSSDNFKNLCKEHASNAMYQGPSMVAMQDDNSSVWSYLRGHLQGLKVCRLNVIEYLDELLLDADIKSVLKKMYGEKEYKKKGNVGWKKYSIGR